ncbi:hypothetical protein PISMIDRAFT_25217 [Pisolithus microcarpus 441]|uniref:Unplaced genomic scaffold scaffold_191, whole genome shotgun sequence n=1 Tax=Pisolithus microcarpus 441 TaxID=765257 RepID=A0A0C9YPW1_9AGAM|nr:hypothetical protein PISMIDRAFT_25217 [Pisolithus microcarpus 441]
MLENHHIDIDEEEVEEEEDEDEKEDDYETTRRMLIMQQVQNYKIASAFITLVMAAMEATQSSSGESDDECSSHYSSLVSPDKSSHNDHEQAVRSGDTYDIRMQRVRLWRDTVIKSTLTALQLSGGF